MAWDEKERTMRSTYVEYMTTGSNNSPNFVCSSFRQAPAARQGNMWTGHGNAVAVLDPVLDLWFCGFVPFVTTKSEVFIARFAAYNFFNFLLNWNNWSLGAFQNISDQAEPLRCARVASTTQATQAWLGWQSCRGSTFLPGNRGENHGLLRFTEELKQKGLEFECKYL